MDAIDTIFELFETRGSAAYLGEPVSQREHALQAAHLAQSDHASDALIVATLLHDIGHLLDWNQDNPADHGLDAQHEEKGSVWLFGYFGLQVSEPVRLHVIAKRYLCAVDPGYLAWLSPASIRSLDLQGGPLSREERRRFEANSFHQDAVRLREWDDAAKKPGWSVPVMTSYTDQLRHLLIR